MVVEFLSIHNIESSPWEQRTHCSKSKIWYLKSQEYVVMILCHWNFQRSIVGHHWWSTLNIKLIRWLLSFPKILVSVLHMDEPGWSIRSFYSLLVPSCQLHYQLQPHFYNYKIKFSVTISSQYDDSYLFQRFWYRCFIYGYARLKYSFFLLFTCAYPLTTLLIAVLFQAIKYIFIHNIKPIKWLLSFPKILVWVLHKNVPYTEVFVSFFCCCDIRTELLFENRRNFSNEFLPAILWRLQDKLLFPLRLQ